MTQRHITILRCDDVPEPDRSRHGDSHEQVGRHLQTVASSIGMEIALSVVDVRDNGPPGSEHRADLYVYTGSAAAPFDDDPWIARLVAWIQAANLRKARMYGICFGHQVIAHALGGQTRRAADWEVGVVSMQQRLELRPGGACAPIEPARGSEKRLLMSHQDEVHSLPEGALRWLECSACPEQGWVVTCQIVTVQGHPEYWTAQIRDLYERRRATLGEDRTNAAQASAANPHDGQAVTAAVLRHLLR